MLPHTPSAAADGGGRRAQLSPARYIIDASAGISQGQRRSGAPFASAAPRPRLFLGRA